MRCVVIGSGCAGLTCAIIMAKNGYDVTVVEKSVRKAPLLQGFERKGFYFDTGVHCLSGLDAGGPLRSLLEYLNIHTPLSYKPFVKNRSFTVHFPNDVVWDMPQGYTPLLKSLVALFPSEKEGLTKFLEQVRTVSNCFQYGANFQAIEEHPLANKSLEEVIDAFITKPQLKVCLGVLNNLFCGLVDKETPFVFFASSIGTYFHSCGTFEGGGKALFAAMHHELTSLGGHIVSNNGVTKVLIDNSRMANGVILEDGTHLHSDVLIATCHPACLPDIMPPKSLRKTRQTYYTELESTTSLVGVFGRTHTPVQKLQHSSIIVAPATSPLDDYEFSGVPFSKRQMLITSSQTCEHGNSVSILIPASYVEWTQFEGKKSHHRLKGYAEQKRRAAAEIIEAATKYLPELANNFSTLSISTPLTIKDYCYAPHGAAYGVKRSIQQLTPTHAFPIKNMLLSGQAIVGPGILGAMTSGFITCGEIIGHTQLRSEIQKCS